MRGGTLTHNHPVSVAYPEGDPRRGGISFSLEDILLAIQESLAEIRAVSPGYLHSMRPHGRRWPRRAMVRRAYAEARRAEQQEDLVATRDGTLDYATAQADFYHLVWDRVAAQAGLDYAREAR